MNRLKCVLIVDDDRLSNFITEKVVRSLGIASMINTVSDGMAGLEYIKYQCEEAQDYACPDLIILDVNMRLMGGIEFVREFKKLKVHDSVIVILSTLPLEKEDRISFEKLGVTHFYTKPMNAETLTEVMSDYFFAI